MPIVATIGSKAPGTDGARSFLVMTISAYWIFAPGTALLASKADK
jgi:hypothetical protein